MKKILSLFTAIALTFSLAACGVSEQGSSKSTSGEVASMEEKNPPEISKEEFEALATGMTYEEAVALIGGEGEMLSSVDVAGIDTKLYMWQGEGTIVGNANVTFQNNKLTTKAQFGLK